MAQTIIEKIALTDNKASSTVKETKSILQNILDRTLSFNDNSPLNISLLGGDLGRVYFLVNYYIKTKESIVIDKAIGLMEKIMRNFSPNNISSPYSLADGLTGFLHTIDLLTFVGVNVPIDRPALVNQLHTISKSNIDKGYFDFLYGGIGQLDIIKSELTQKQLSDYAKSMLSQQANSMNGVWQNSYSVDGSKKYTPEVNISISHGFLSVLIVLSKIYHILNDQITRNNIKETLDRSLNWILDIKTYDNISLYPYVYEESGQFQFSRLGWCYGDLGIALTIRHLKSVLSDRKGEIESLTHLILGNTYVRLEPHNTKIDNPYFCHGSSGVMYILSEFIEEFPVKDIYSNILFWLQETIQYYSKKPINNLKILEGDLGVAISFLNLEYGSIKNWNELFLIE